jgi:hypothetical protein
LCTFTSENKGEGDSSEENQGAVARKKLTVSGMMKTTEETVLPVLLLRVVYSMKMFWCYES